MPADSIPGVFTTIDMALRYRKCPFVWASETMGVEASDHSAVVVGIENGRAFAIAVHPSDRRPVKSHVSLLKRWQEAGAATGTASTIRAALAILDANHAS